MTERVKQYRLNADKCIELAKRLGDPESKHSLLVIANAWLMLAAQRAKNIETIPYSLTCSRCQSAMVWYNADLNGDRTLQLSYQCEKCGFVSESQDAQSARKRA
jgi:DNA-directed RNA polymerase subunit M/transcription elongation factor TFIIS